MDRYAWLRIPELEFYAGGPMSPFGLPHDQATGLIKITGLSEADVRSLMDAPEPMAKRVLGSALLVLSENAHRHENLIQHKARARRREIASEGGHTKAEKARAKAAELATQLAPLFDQAYAELDADCPKRIGADRLSLRAKRNAGTAHELRSKLTETRARAYLKARKTPRN